MTRLFPPALLSDLIVGQGAEAEHQSFGRD